MSQLAAGSQFGHGLSRAYESIPVLLNVLGRSANHGDDLSYVFGRHHFDCVPGTDGQLVRIRLLLWNVDTHLTTDASLEVDFAPSLDAFHAVAPFVQYDAVDRTDFQARFAAGAVVGIDYRQLLGSFLSWALLRHAFVSFLGLGRQLANRSFSNSG